MTKKTTSKKTPTKKSATKKASAKKRAPKKDSLKAQGLDKVHIDEDGTPCLTEMQLLQWKSSMNESELAKVTWQASEKDISILLSAVPAYRELRSKTDGLKNAFQKRSRDYMTLLTRLSEAVGLDLTMCIINDHTGKITFVDDDGKITGDVPLLGRQK